MNKQWCMCLVLKNVARDGWATCFACGGKDAYGTAMDRPKDMRKILKTCGDCDKFPCGRGGVHPVEKTDRACYTFKQGKKLPAGKGVTITISGPTASGKSYRAEMLVSWLHSKGCKVTLGVMLDDDRKRLIQVMDRAALIGTNYPVTLNIIRDKKPGESVFAAAVQDLKPGESMPIPSEPHCLLQGKDLADSIAHDREVIAKGPERGEEIEVPDEVEERVVVDLLGHKRTIPPRPPAPQGSRDSAALEIAALQAFAAPKGSGGRLTETSLPDTPASDSLPPRPPRMFPGIAEGEKKQAETVKQLILFYIHHRVTYVGAQWKKQLKTKSLENLQRDLSAFTNVEVEATIEVRQVPECREELSIRVYIPSFARSLATCLLAFNFTRQPDHQEVDGKPTIKEVGESKMDDVVVVSPKYPGSWPNARQGDEVPGYASAARFRDELAKVDKTVVQATEAIKSRDEKIRELTGKLDIIVREGDGEAPDGLAADYGGTGWEKSPEVSAVRKQRVHQEARYDNRKRDQFKAAFTDSAQSVQCAACGWKGKHSDLHGLEASLCPNCQSVVLVPDGPAKPGISSEIITPGVKLKKRPTFKRPCPVIGKACPVKEKILFIDESECSHRVLGQCPNDGYFAVWCGKVIGVCSAAGVEYEAREKPVVRFVPIEKEPFEQYGVDTDSIMAEITLMVNYHLGMRQEEADKEDKSILSAYMHCVKCGQKFTAPKDHNAVHVPKVCEACAKKDCPICGGTGQLPVGHPGTGFVSGRTTCLECRGSGEKKGRKYTLYIPSWATPGLHEVTMQRISIGEMFLVPMPKDVPGSPQVVALVEVQKEKST